MRRVAVLTLFAWLAANSGVFGQNGPDNDPDGAPGYVNNVFHQGQVDSINLYNGQLTVPIALGPSYSVGPKLKVQAMLTYGSRVFDFGHPEVQNPDHTYTPIAGDPALGIGWTFTFGAIKVCRDLPSIQLCFVGADGSRHLFEYQVQGTTGDYKTTDASQLYLHTLPNNGGYQVWDGDGNRYDLTWQVSGFDDVISTQLHTGYTRDFGRGRDGWYAKVITDSYGNSFSVDYFDTAADGISFPCWTYDDSNCAPLTHMVCSPLGKTKSWIPKTVNLPGGTIDVHLNSSGQLWKIDFPVFAGGAATDATWTFGYDPAPVPVSWSCGYLTSTTIEMRHLTSITLPGGFGSYGFDYDSTSSLLDHIDLPSTGSLDYCYASYVFFHGRISKMEPGCSQQVPDTTDAGVDGTSESNCGAAAPEEPPAIPGGCQTSPNATQYYDTQDGVVRRSERAVAGGTPAVTHYTQYAFPWGEQGDKTHTTGGSQTLTVVVSPSDNDGHVSSKAVLFYSGPKNPASAFYNGDRTGADIQERVFDSDPRDAGHTMPRCGPNATTEATYCASKAQRVTSRTYDYDTQTSEIGNRRLSSETICYGSLVKATGACSTTTSHKVAYTNTPTCPPPIGTNLCAWDGDNGRHYNQEKHTDGSGATLRTIATAWTPKQWNGTPAANTAALPNLSSQHTVSEGSYMVDERPEFKSDDGFLLGKVSWDHGSGIVWLHCWYDDGNGSPTNDFTATYPGYSYPSSPPPATPCHTVYPDWTVNVLSTNAFGNSDAFGKGRTFQNGLLLTSAWWDNVAGVQKKQGWFTRNYVRNAATGWVTTSYDTGGQATGYVYDVLGRVTSISAPGETPIGVSYDTTTKTTVTRGSLTWEQYIYDGLGRLIREINQTGASAYAVRTHGFDAVGREYLTSEWGSCTSPTGDCLSTNPLGTTRSNYDPFSRPQAVTGPGNATYVATSRTDGTILYSDTKEAVSTCVNGTWSGSACSSGALSTTTSVKDLFGRVKSVTDPAAGFTSYTYDVNDKLRTVSQGAQSRTFAYNAFGYLTQEITPEKGTVNYANIAVDPNTRHGSLGNARIKIEGTSPSQVTHSYTYDGAGRLAQDLVGSVQYALNCYDGNGTADTATCKDGTTSNFNGGTMSGGKITRRLGANPLFTPLYPATAATELLEEDMTYGGLGGRISVKNVTMLGSPSGLTIGGVSRASETWGYNSLGLVSSHKHPRVGGLSTQFQETMTYTNGRLSSLGVTGKDYDNTPIPAITVTPTFRAAGNLGSYTSQQSGASNSLVTIVYQDSSGIPRPRQIQGSAGGSFLFDTGNMTYDAAGNILSMGTDQFTYDSLSRLLSANLGPSQTYTYDAYGNLLTKAGTTFCTTSCANNKIPSATYDTRGNMLTYGGETLTYDANNRQSKDFKSSITWQYLYSGGDERLVRVPASAPGTVPRREIARYIVQGKPYTPYTGTCADGVPFADVHCTDPDFIYIYAISMASGQAGLTSGCGGMNYCPDSATTRAQAAVLFMKAEHGKTYSPACAGTYVDAPCSDPTSAYVEVAITEQVLFTCSSGHACPSAPITEADAVKGMADGSLWNTYKPIAGGSLYTLRDNDNRIVTEFADSLPSRDNIYIGNVAVASYLGKQPGVPGSWQFHSSDHLGTIRLTVDAATCGSVFLQQPKYWPYGDLLTPVVPPLQRVGFATMERDSENNHFYDHARHHDFNLGRFTSPDRLGGHATDPQSWNRNSYARGNPIRLLDPNGLAPTESEIKVLWTNFKHFVARHVSKDVEIGASKFKTNDPRRAAKLVEQTIKPSNLVEVQEDGRRVYVKEFNKVIGTEGETTVKAVTEPLGSTVENVVTAHPVMDFLLSFVPGIAELDLFKDATKAAATGAQKFEDAAQQGAAGELKRREMEAEEEALSDQLHKPPNN